MSSIPQVISHSCLLLACGVGDLVAAKSVTTKGAYLHALELSYVNVNVGNDNRLMTCVISH